MMHSGAFWSSTSAGAVESTRNAGRSAGAVEGTRNAGAAFSESQRPGTCARFWYSSKVIPPSFQVGSIEVLHDKARKIAKGSSEKLAYMPC